MEYHKNKSEGNFKGLESKTMSERMTCIEASLRRGQDNQEKGFNDMLDYLKNQPTEANIKQLLVDHTRALLHIVNNGPDAVASNEGPHVEGDDQEEVANEDDARSKQNAPTNLSRQAHSGALLPTCEVYGQAFHWLEGGHTGSKAQVPRLNTSHRLCVPIRWTCIPHIKPKVLAGCQRWTGICLQALLLK